MLTVGISTVTGAFVTVSAEADSVENCSVVIGSDAGADVVGLPVRKHFTDPECESGVLSV